VDEPPVQAEEDPASSSWAATFTVRKSLLGGSHGSAVLNPAFGSSLHCIGVRINSSGLAPVMPISSP